MILEGSMPASCHTTPTAGRFCISPYFVLKKKLELKCVTEHLLV